MKGKIKAIKNKNGYKIYLFSNTIILDFINKLRENIPDLSRFSGEQVAIAYYCFEKYRCDNLDEFSPEPEIKEPYKLILKAHKTPFIVNKLYAHPKEEVKLIKEALPIIEKLKKKGIKINWSKTNKKMVRLMYRYYPNLKNSGFPKLKVLKLFIIMFYRLFVEDDTLAFDLLKKLKLKYEYMGFRHIVLSNSYSDIYRILIGLSD